MTGKPVLTRHVAAGCWVLMGAFAFSVMNALAKQIAITRGVGIPHWRSPSPATLSPRCSCFRSWVVQPTRLRVEAPARYVWRTIAGWRHRLMFEAVRSITLASATASDFTSPIFAMVFRQSRSKSGSYVAGGWRRSQAFAEPSSSRRRTSRWSASGRCWRSPLGLHGRRGRGGEVAEPDTGRKVTILFFSNLAGALLAGAWGLRPCVADVKCGLAPIRGRRGRLIGQAA